MIPSIYHSRSVLCLTTTIGIAATLGSLLAATLVRTQWKRTSGPPQPKLRRYQIVLSVGILCLSIAHCVALTQYNVKPTGTDPVLLSALFEMLCWILLCIVLFEQDAGWSLHSAWVTSSAFQVVGTDLTMSTEPNKASAVWSIDTGILLVRVACTFALLGGGIILQIKHGVASGETQPLLHAEKDKTETEDQMDGQPLLHAEKDNTETEDQTDGQPLLHAEKDNTETEDSTETEDQTELNQQPLRQYIASFGVLIPYLMPSTLQQWLCISIISFCIIVDGVMNMLAPITFGVLTESLPSAIEHQAMPWKPLGIYLALGAFRLTHVIYTIQWQTTGYLEAQLKRSLGTFCYGHLIGLSSDYHDAKNTANVLRDLERVESMAYLFSNIFLYLLPSVGNVLIAFGIMTWLFGGYLGFVTTTTIVLVGYSYTKSVKQQAHLQRKINKTTDVQQFHRSETLTGWHTVSHFGREDFEKDRALKYTAQWFESQISAEIFRAVARSARQVILSLGFLFAVFSVIRQIVYEGRGIGGLMTMFGYWNQATGPITYLIRLLDIIVKNFVDAEHVVLLLKRTPTIQDPPGAEDVAFRGGSVEFKNVSFSYDGKRKVTREVSFKVDAGKTVAIVGETGGGKSTLLNLLFRFYDPTEGHIEIDGQDISQFNIKSVRDLIGFVPQNPMMFSRTVAGNVRYGKLTASDEEVEAACKRAELHDKIMTFTKGYDQKVGEQGTKLSGGEKQRLAIARVLLQNPKILLLDEATSSVDNITENKIRESLYDICKGRTTFIIAHRLSTIRDADLIMVMENGRLIEMGSHQELILKTGYYHKLWTAQLAGQPHSHPPGCRSEPATVE